jgi:hypothetical protein
MPPSQFASLLRATADAPSRRHGSSRCRPLSNAVAKDATQNLARRVAGNFANKRHPTSQALVRRHSLIDEDHEVTGRYHVTRAGHYKRSGNFPFVRIRRCHAHYCHVCYCWVIA